MTKPKLIGGQTITDADPLQISPGITAEIYVTPVLTVHANYASGDYVGTSGVAIIFANAARYIAGSGIIQSAMLIDGDNQKVNAELWLFDTPVTPPADSAAWTLSAADLAHCLGVIAFGTYYAAAAAAVAPAVNCGLAFIAEATSRNLYGCLVTRGTPAYNSGNLSVNLYIRQD